MNLNKAWIYLILIGIVALVAVLGWEYYQVSTGNRDEFELNVNQMSSGNLISPELEKHLQRE